MTEQPAEDPEAAAAAAEWGVATEVDGAGAPAAEVVQPAAAAAEGMSLVPLFVPMDSVERLDVAAGTWEAAPPLPHPRGFHGSAVGTTKAGGQVRAEAAARVTQRSLCVRSEVYRTHRYSRCTVHARRLP